MLIRIVRMTLRPDAIEKFLGYFDQSSGLIRQFPGCEHLELWQDADNPHILTTYSHWIDAQALAHYRESDLFQNTWAKVRPLFAARTEVFSARLLRG